MNELLKKLNYTGQDPAVVLNAPENMDALITALERSAKVHTKATKLKGVGFAMAFATRQTEVDKVAKDLTSCMEGDAVLWLCYPKGSSKRYTCDFNRDTGWKVLGELGFEPVRQVAVDEDWSALRFRRVGYIKKMTRSFAMTDEGKAKVEKKG
jgi:hypothetical protein